MSNTMEIVIAGVLVLVFVQVFLKWVISPIRQLKKTMADILHTFVRYAYVIHYVDVVPSDLHSEVFEKLRRLSGELYDDVALIPKCIFRYPFFRKVFILPEEEMVYKCAKNLIAVANWMNVKHENKLEHII